jgi:hypothetical protein
MEIITEKIILPREKSIVAVVVGVSDLGGKTSEQAVLSVLM